MTTMQEAPASAARAALAGDHASLTVHGKDGPGIVAALASVLSRHGANIVSLDQYSDNPEGGAFFQRTVFTVKNLKAVLPVIEADLADKLGHGLGLDFSLRDLSVPRRAAVFASKSDHCLLDLLWRQRRGELAATIPVVISNHPDVAEEVRSFRVPFVHVPSTGPDKSAAEAEHLRLLKGNVDFIVLARYMQVISGAFIAEIGVPIINIHHSFLPAFIGAGPYAKAKERGVKLIGATAHYVTEDLDQGPIIEQDVVRVSHADTVADLQRRGADVERLVLSRAVKWHSEDRIIRHGNHTIVFPLARGSGAAGTLRDVRDFAERTCLQEASRPPRRRRRPPAEVKAVRRARLVVFLREYRHELFDEDFQAEPAQAHTGNPKGQPPVPPAQLALATILQACAGVSDDEVIEAVVMDRRWQLVADCMDAQEPPFPSEPWPDSASG